MYIKNDFCAYKLKGEENKCARIFRPWDSEDEDCPNVAQDSTVSTTTKDEEAPGKCDKEVEKQPGVSPLEIGCTSRLCLSSAQSTSPNSSKTPEHPTSELSLINIPPSAQENFLATTPLALDYLQEPFPPLNADFIQANLAQHLGLPPNDPLLLESFAQGYALEEYARVLSQEQQTKLLASKKQRPKKYKCPHCDVGFSNNGQLKGHVRIHTGERPFKCDEKECGKTFTRNEELTRHKRIHSGLRPYPCSHCGKRFGRKDHLKKHSRTHFQPRGLYAVPVVLPFEAWASGQANGYPFFPVMY